LVCRCLQNLTFEFNARSALGFAAKRVGGGALAPAARRSARADIVSAAMSHAPLRTVGKAAAAAAAEAAAEAEATATLHQSLTLTAKFLQAIGTLHDGAARAVCTKASAAAAACCSSNRWLLALHFHRLFSLSTKRSGGCSVSAFFKPFLSISFCQVGYQ